MKTQPRDKLGRVMKGNTLAKKKQTTVMQQFVKHKNKKILKMVMKEAKAGNDKALLWLARKCFGDKPVNTLILPHGKSSAKMLKVLIKNSNSLPLEVIQQLIHLVESNSKLSEMKDLADEIEAIKKTLKKKGNGFK